MSENKKENRWENVLVINNGKYYRSIERKEIRLGKTRDEGKEEELEGKVHGEGGVADARNDRTGGET